MLLVEIEKPENLALATWFAELRTWFDTNHCEPAVFARSGRRLDRLIYRVSFTRAAEAHRFARAFAQYWPTVRRAGSVERDQSRTIAESGLPRMSAAAVGAGR